jgi:4-hydroxybenzoate polyprenyltransferase
MKTAVWSFRNHLPFTGLARLTRLPNLVMIAIAQYLAAIFLIGGHADWLQYLTDYKLFLLVTSTVLIAAAGYVINDYYDVKIDFINKPNRVIVGKVVKRRTVMGVHILLNFSGIFIGFYLSLTVGVIHLMAAFLLWLYSNQLKRLPFVGNFTIALLSGLAISIVAIYYDSSYVLVNSYALFAFAISLVREIIKDIEDLKGDATFGCKTLPIVWGVPRTKNLLYVMVALFTCMLFFVSGVLGNWLLIIYFFTLLIPIVIFAVRLVQADTQREFSYLSSLCKLIMLGGILSMLLF